MKEQVLEEYLEIQNEIIAECNKRLENAERWDIHGLLQTKMMAANGIFAALRDYGDDARRTDAMTEWREHSGEVKAVNAQSLAVSLRAEKVLERFEAILDRMEAKQ